ncbi:hypothetical protein RE2895_55360 [Rhodococcus erythropolis]|nr:hypothetical protein RE2895_55360 [Rhodococcus erythropolis]
MNFGMPSGALFALDAVLNPRRIRERPASSVRYDGGTDVPSALPHRGQAALSRGNSAAQYQ